MSDETPLRDLGQRMLADSERWFPMVHSRGRAAITTHLTFGVAGEAGEVVDVVKKADVCGWSTTCGMHAAGKHDRAALAEEMADLLTYLLALAAHEGIDLDASYRNKRQANCGRWGEP